MFFFRSLRQKNPIPYDLYHEKAQTASEQWSNLSDISLFWLVNGDPYFMAYEMIPMKLGSISSPILGFDRCSSRKHWRQQIFFSLWSLRNLWTGGWVSKQIQQKKEPKSLWILYSYTYIYMYIYVYIKLSIHSTYTCNVHSMYISFFLCILKHISTRICEKLPPISKSGRQFPSNRNWEPRAGGAKDAAAPGGEIK